MDDQQQLAVFVVMLGRQGYRIWYRHSGEKAIEDVPRSPNLQTVRNVGDVLSHIGFNHITHLIVNGVLPDLRALSPRVQRLRIIELTNPKMLDCLASLKEIEALEFWWSDFTRRGLPEGISQPKCLKVLILPYCQLTTLPPSLVLLTQIEVLHITWSDFSRGLCEVITQLRSLKELMLYYCQLSTLPSSFSNLQKLEKLNISWNNFEEMPAVVCKLKCLRTLIINNNKKLMAINQDIFQLRHLRFLDCDSCCNLKFPPYGVCEQGLPAVLQYFKDLAAGSAIDVSVAPIAVLGSTMAGKTSLVQSLQDGKRRLTHREEASLHDEATKAFKMEDLSLRDSEVKFIDFGGHRVYHIAYQLTLKEKCVPLLVVNMKHFSDISSERGSREATRRLCFDWIAHIYLSCPRLGAPILVMTHRDQLENETFNLHKDELMRNTDEIRHEVLEEEKALSEGSSDFCQIVHLADVTSPVFAGEDVFTFSNDLIERSNISSLQRNLELRCNDFKETIPALWLHVGVFIDEQTENPFILVSDIEKEFPGSDLCIILRYMHNVGKILWYENKESLSKYIFHQIDSITSLVSLIFDHSKEAAWKERVAAFSAFRHCQLVIEREHYVQMVDEFLSSGVMSETILVNLIQKDTRFPDNVALALLHSFSFIHGPIKRGSRYNYVIPYFSTRYIDRSWRSDGYLQLRADIQFKGLPIPEYVYQLITVGVLNLNSNITNKFEVFKNGTTIRHGKTSTHVVHDYNNSTLMLQISTTPELVGASWERLLGTVQHVNQQATSLFKAARTVLHFYCSHCLFLREPNPDSQVCPDWFQPNCRIEPFSGIEPVPCHNTRSGELVVLQPLKFPCYELTPAEISELKDYLSLLEPRRHVNPTAISCTNQPESGTKGSGETDAVPSPAEYGDSDLSDVEEEGYTDDSRPKVINHRLMATSHPRIKALYDNPKVYQMSDGVRGRVLIFNIKIFSNNGELCDNRRGSEVDYSNLSRLFTAMRFDVVKTEKELTDLTAEQIFSEIKEETALPVHSSLGMFVLVIMTNGSRENILFDCDYQPVDLVKIKDLLSPVHFPAMKGKPKLVIIQACSGGRVDLGNMDTYFPAQSVAGTASVALEPITLHVDDFYVMKASSESYIATRSPTHGSWFIRILVATFYKHACHRDLASLFEIIQNRVRQVGIAFTDRMKMSMKPSGVNVPIGYGTFTNYRKLYFFPQYFGSPPEQPSVDE